MKGSEQMKITEKSVKTAAAILTALSENKCTVAESKEILEFCERTVLNRATVPADDYLADFTARFLNPAS